MFWDGKQGEIRDINCELHIQWDKGVGVSSFRSKFKISLNIRFLDYKNNLPKTSGFINVIVFIRTSLSNV